MDIVKDLIALGVNRPTSGASGVLNASLKLPAVRPDTPDGCASPAAPDSYARRAASAQHDWMRTEHHALCRDIAQQAQPASPHRSGREALVGGDEPFHHLV